MRGCQIGECRVGSKEGSSAMQRLCTVVTFAFLVMKGSRANSDDS